MSWNQPRRLYVAEFKCGVVKVGITAKPAQIRDRLLKLDGASPVRVHYGKHHECGFWGERELISQVGLKASKFKGREWFTGVGFEEVRVLLDQITDQAIELSALPS